MCNAKGMIKGSHVHMFRRTHVPTFKRCSDKQQEVGHIIGSTLPAWLSVRFPTASLLEVLGDFGFKVLTASNLAEKTKKLSGKLIGMFFQVGIGAVHVLFVPSLWSIKQSR